MIPLLGILSLRALNHSSTRHSFDVPTGTSRPDFIFLNSDALSNSSWRTDDFKEDLRARPLHEKIDEGEIFMLGRTAAVVGTQHTIVPAVISMTLYFTLAEFFFYNF